MSSLELRAFTAARTRVSLVALLVGVAALAWWSTIQAMSGMGASPGADIGALGWFSGVWVVMMAAVMLPAVSPTVALYSRMTKRRSYIRPVAFTGAYLAVWGAAGIVAYVLYALGRHAFGGQLAWHSGGRWLAGTVLVVAAVYELTPLKDVCLNKCRSSVSSWDRGETVSAARSRWAPDMQRGVSDAAGRSWPRCSCSG